MLCSMKIKKKLYYIMFILFTIYILIFLLNKIMDSTNMDFNRDENF